MNIQQHSSNQSRSLINQMLLAGCALGGAGLLFWNVRLWRREQRDADAQRELHGPTPVLHDTPLVSVLVAAWNEGPQIDAHLASFLTLRYPKIELIICAGGEDATYERAFRFANERILVLEQHPGEGKQAALARAYNHARGQVLYLTDADCLFDDDALLRLLAPLVNECELAATGSSRPLDEQMEHILPRYLWASDLVAAVRSPRYTEGLLGRNAAMKRAALERAGGLNFVAETGTDYQLARRLLASGTRIRAVPDSVVPSEFPDTLAIYRRKQSRWLRNLLHHGWRYGATNDIAVTLRTVATGAIMLILPWLALVFGWLPLGCWLLLLMQAVFAKLRYAAYAERISGRPTPRLLYGAALPLTLIDFLFWVLPVRDLLTKRGRNRW